MKKRWTKITSIVLTLVLALGMLCGCGSGSGSGAEDREYGLIDGEWVSYADPEKTTIRLTNQDGTTFMINTIQKIIYEEGLGYPTEEVVGSVLGTLESVARDEADVHNGVWRLSLQGYDKIKEMGTTTEISTLVADNCQGFMVPRYVIEGDPERGIEPMAPDLKKVQDLTKYADLFKDPEDPSKGRIYNAPPTFQAHNVMTTKYENYGLKDYYNLIEADMLPQIQTLKAAYEKGEPWLGYGFTPYYLYDAYDVVLLQEDQEYDPELFTEEAGFTCEWPNDDSMNVVNNTLYDRAPEACDFLEGFEWDKNIYNDVNIIQYEVFSDDNGYTAAIFYLKAYPENWQKNLPQDAIDRVETYLDEYVIPNMEFPLEEAVEKASAVDGFNGGALAE